MNRCWLIFGLSLVCSQWSWCSNVAKGADRDASLVLHLRADDLPRTSQDSEVVDRWPDASGKIVLSQEKSSGQPKRVWYDKDSIVRFDGENDSLRTTEGISDCENATFTIVASPRRRGGDFSGFFAANAPRQRDYESGFNLDLGPNDSVGVRASSQHTQGREIKTINAEGRGFGGAVNMLRSRLQYGTLHVFSLTLNHQTKRVTLYVDGKLESERDSTGDSVSFQELTLGARCLSNGEGASEVRCFLECDVAEVRLYNRTLNADEIAASAQDLQLRYAKLAASLAIESDGNRPSIELVKAENPPPIQMLVPGFRVQEIPIELNNTNNVRYRDDGVLVTLGYNGDIHLLRDTDGDGLEDQASLFWKNQGSIRGPIGIQLTPKNYSYGRGVLVPSKGKVSLIVDTDGDDLADEEKVIATGWTEITPSVDATGIVMADDGSIYFGLGTANYANAYLVDENGKAAYDLESDRGSVQRISPDFKNRETICTGIRFPIAFAFNERNDLFCTDQEGATWLSNGNPFDELLHIQPKRHYGFPPRHPKHNPKVIDEPSVFDYSPQHQSTCGMVFNVSVNGGPVFGPEHWANQAIVVGESRGKIWRTQLVHSDEGYVAGTQLIACLQMLSIDACVAPDGGLVVACHSGPPDWGTGPTGKGKLFKIVNKTNDIARPVIAYPQNERELAIEFDRPLSIEFLRKLNERIHIEFGETVRAGDRYENLVPPYAAVERQLARPRSALLVHAISVSADRRTLLIQTDPMLEQAHYAVCIDGIQVDDQKIEAIEIDFALDGVQASWQSTDGMETWAGWLPHLSSTVNNALMHNSRSLQQLQKCLSANGKLTLKTTVNLSDLLRPSVQPGATLDYEWPKEIGSIKLRSNRSFLTTTSNGMDASHETADGVPVERFESSVSTDERAKKLPLNIEIETLVDRPFVFECFTWTNEDERPRAVPLSRFLLPFSLPFKPTDESHDGSIRIAELEGGNWGLGKKIFESETAKCSKCHAMQGVGPKIGPDLTNLVHRTYPAVMRDILHPSFAINPDHLGQILLTKDDRIISGVIQSTEGRITIGDNQGNVVTIEKDDVESMKPSEISIMPTGLLDKSSPEEIQHLMTYLMTPPPQMPLSIPPDTVVPGLRSIAEVNAVLAGSVPLPTGPQPELRPIKIVLVAGNKDHGPGEHDYPAWQVQWQGLLSAAKEVEADVAWSFPNESQLASADVLIFFQKGTWDDARQKAMDAYFARGGGAVYLHWAVNGEDRVSDFSRRIGLSSRGTSIKYRHGPLSLEIHHGDDPIMRNIKQLELYDESYWLLTGELSNIKLLATSIEDGQARPQIWTYEPSQGRVFVSIPGHYSWTFDDPIFRTMILRAIAWTAKEPIDRFNEIVLVGARVSK
jgi:putative heme-binding domain-containing protein